MYGFDANSDALYLGIDNSWDRVFPNSSGSYQWVRVEVTNNSGSIGFDLNQGVHVIQVGHGEINARLDALYVTDDPNATPTPPDAPGPIVYPTLPGMTSPVQDLDGDQTAEDLNGNGRLDFDDVVTLFEFFNSPTVQDNQAVFDYNGNGQVDMDDVITLFDMLVN